ncbi:hypothetical protein, partial [Arthrobacter sp. H5]|uniref:hypothetical protein n=1 Tax=Arthrobacter sp. H5 TaxID=1267973 RepID=UPI001C1E36FC
MVQDIQLDLHALLGVFTVLTDGEQSRWPQRAKDGRQYMSRFKQAVDAAAEESEDFDLIRGIRNYAQHYAAVPFSITQTNYESGVATVDLRLVLQSRLFL